VRTTPEETRCRRNTSSPKSLSAVMRSDA
jgi:hypothetical protein